MGGRVNRRINTNWNRFGDRRLYQQTRNLLPRLLFYSAYQRREKRVAPKTGLPQQQRVWLERFAKEAFQGLGEGGHNERAIVCEGKQAHQAVCPFLISVNSQAGGID